MEYKLPAAVYERLYDYQREGVHWSLPPSIHQSPTGKQRQPLTSSPLSHLSRSSLPRLSQLHARRTGGILGDDMVPLTGHSPSHANQPSHPHI